MPSYCLDRFDFCSAVLEANRLKHTFADDVISASNLIFDSFAGSTLVEPLHFSPLYFRASANQK